MTRHRFALFLLLASLAACADRPTAPRRDPVDLTAEWQTATPALFQYTPVAISPKFRFTASDAAGKPIVVAVP